MSDLVCVDFPQANVKFAEHQDDYITLPAYREDDDTGLVISCWRLSWWQRVVVLFTGKLWHQQLTYGEPLQPVIVHTGNPFKQKEMGR